MGIVRDVPLLVTGRVGTFHSASTWSPATTGSTANMHENATTYYGQVVDRLELPANYRTVDAALWLHSTITSTISANTPQSVLLSVWLQHGASSGAGDFAALTPPLTYSTPCFFTSVDTTDLNKATTYLGKTSTGSLNPGIGVVNTYDLNGAYRYVRVAYAVSASQTSTCTHTFETGFVNASLIFRDADQLPQKTTGVPLFSTSTVCST